MKLKISLLKITFSICIFLFLYMLYKDFKTEGGLKGYYLTQSYFFLALGILFFIISFFTKKIQNYFLIIFLSIIFSLFFFEFFIYYKGGIKFFPGNESTWENRIIALQKEIKKDGGFPTISIKNENLMSLSGISNSKIVQCNESGFYAKYKSDRNGFRNPDYVWSLDELDVVTLGDSQVHGDCVKDGNDVSSQIRKLTGLNIINIGWRGSGPLRQYANFREYMPKKPKYIFWWYYETDIYNLRDELKNEILIKYLRNEEFSQNLINRRSEIDSLIKKEFKNFMKTSFKATEANKFKNLISFIKLYKTRQIILTKLSYFLKSNENTKVDLTNDNNLKTYFEIVERMKKLAEKNDSKLVLVFIPAFKYEFSYNGIYFKSIKKEIFNKMKKNNIGIIDIEKLIKENYVFPNVLYPKLSTEYHFNKKGYKFVAEQVAEYIAKN